MAPHRNAALAAPLAACHNGTRIRKLVSARLCHAGAGWSSPVARQAHNLKVTGSNPVPATNTIRTPERNSPGVFAFLVSASAASWPRGPCHAMFSAAGQASDSLLVQLGCHAHGTRGGWAVYAGRPLRRQASRCRKRHKAGTYGNRVGGLPIGLEWTEVNSDIRFVQGRTGDFVQGG